MEGGSIDIRNGGLEDDPPPLPDPKKLSGICALLSQMQLMSKQINIEFRKKESKILN